jgi:mRNA-degrading endonuclease HigB of HigAB toxin-antitoxin module
MYLIAKNKIADYIKKHPEAETAFLVWLEQFPYIEGKHLLANAYQNGQTHTNGDSEFGSSKYHVRYHVSYLLKTAYIEWVGTSDEFMKGYLKNVQAMNPGVKLEHKVKITHVELRPPDPIAIIEQRKAPPVETVSVEEPPVSPSLTEEQIKSLYLFETHEEYEAGLARAIEIFFAQPASKERLELASLVPRLVHYERKYINLPDLDPIADSSLKVLEHLIKLKNVERGMADQYTSDLIKLVGSKENLDQFLASEKPLPKQVLTDLYNYLGLNSQE